MKHVWNATGAALVLAAGQAAYGQWTTSGTDIYNSNTGEIGIGVTAPSIAKLHMQTGGAYLYSMFIKDTSTSAVVRTFWAESASTNGWGVVGKASSTTGETVGVWGQTESNTGSGVVGYSHSNTGNGVGVFAWAESPDGYGVYSVASNNYFSGNVGVGTNAAAAQLHTTGTVRHAGLTAEPANTKVLTVDAAGNLATRRGPLVLADAKEYGAVGNGTTDDTTAIHQMIDAYINGGGAFAGTYLPNGVYRSNSGISYPQHMYGTFRGSGKHLEYNNVNGWSQGSAILVPSTATAPAFNFVTHGMKFEEFSVIGHDITNLGSARAPIGIRVQYPTTGGGLGTGMATFSHVAMQGFVVGFDAGGGSSANNSADITFNRCDWNHCDVGFQTNHNQAVNFELTSPTFYNCGVCFDFPFAGGVTVSNLSTGACPIIVRSGPAGPNVGANTFTNLKMEDWHPPGGAGSSRLYVAAGGTGDKAKTTFINPHFSVGPSNNPARIYLKSGHQVTIIGGENLCANDGTMPLFDMDGGTLLVIGARLPADFAANVRGTVTGGTYRFRDCIDEDTGAFLADESYP